MSKFNDFWERIILIFKVFLEKIGFKYGMRLALYEMENISYDRLIDAIVKKDYTNENIVYETDDGYGDRGGSGKSHNSPIISSVKKPQRSWFWPVFSLIVGIIIAIILVLWAVKAQ